MLNIHSINFLVVIIVITIKLSTWSVAPFYKP